MQKSPAYSCLYPLCFRSTSRSAFFGLPTSHLPPNRRITHDEASAAMGPTANAAARAPAAGPAAPAPVASITTHPSGAPTSRSFASGGFGAGPAAPPPAPSTAYTNTTGAYPGAGGQGQGGGMSRLSGNGSESVAGNTRKKARMG